MHGTKELIDEAAALPIDERILVVDALLKTLNSPDNDVDLAWGTTAQERLNALRNGAVQGIPSEEVFSKVHGRLAR